MILVVLLSPKLDVPGNLVPRMQWTCLWVVKEAFTRGAVAFCEVPTEGAKNLLYATIFHSLAGAVTGSVFRTRTLLLLLAIVGFEALILAASDLRAALMWALINVSAVQVSYIAGLFARGMLEQAGVVLPPARIRRP